MNAIGVTYQNRKKYTISETVIVGPESTFNIGTGFNAGVESISVQSDGKILVGGDFTSYQDETYNYLIRLNDDGTVDDSFDIGTGFDGLVLCIKVQSDGKILVGGDFTTYKGESYSSIIRLNSDGSIDTSFVIGSGFGSTSDPDVRCISITSTGQILVGGSFDTYQSEASKNIIQLNSNGSIDTSFVVGTGFDDVVRGIAIQSDDKAVVIGSFTTYQGESYNRIIRLDTDGSIDTSFVVGTGFNSHSYMIIMQSDGKFIVGGGATTYKDISYSKIIRLDTDGSIDETFVIGGGFNSSVYGGVLLDDNKILLIGNFTAYNGDTYSRILQLNSNGSVDSSFDLGAGFTTSTPWTIAKQTDGKYVIGGFFTYYNGVSYNRIVRLNTDGSTDTITN